MYAEYDLRRLTSAASEFVILNDRDLFSPFLSAIEEYAANHKIIVGGLNGIAILLGRKKNRDSYVYELYCDDPETHLRKICDAIAKVSTKYIDRRTIFGETNLQWKIYTIWCGGRILAKLYGLQGKAESKAVEVKMAIEARGLFSANSLLCMRPEVQLIDIYRRIYTPYIPLAENMDYDTAIGLENDLFAYFRENVTKNIGKIGGGSSDNTIGRVKKLALEFGAIICGDYAAAELISREKFGSGRLQLIYGGNHNDFLRAAKFEVKSFNLRIPGEYLLNKYIFYEGGKAVFDVYDATAFELIPYKMMDGIKYAEIPVILRFKLIDLYALFMLAEIGDIDVSAAIKKNIGNIMDIRQVYAGKPTSAASFAAFDGIYLRRDLALKKKFATKFHVKYYPPPN